ncbi:tRNA epoxyqueuosine(34) reductase QueG [Prosthecobacter vanneervenii]|uniref:Epoxyqueuosine reductase n=1 Tax=Prosthecobacter vanneervenii TaxID=48466 RepID=A0A7W8DLK8_9BACT|nr:tRNA epoxyqueuosine(34) reductase QueG [Prosthecobacter vanneervenii]MBB5034489.1 epoxyqueuosine reductase [Prosthecobacter vanneervenii]
MGFDDCRIAPAQPAAHRALFEQWIADGKHGDMAWLARTPERRTDPTLVLPGAKSVILLALNYYQGGTPYPQDQSSPEHSESPPSSSSSYSNSSSIPPLRHPPSPRAPQPSSSDSSSPERSESSEAQRAKDGQQPLQTTANHCKPPPTSYRVARYAWNNDYHDLIESKLRTLTDFLTTHGGTQRPYVDTGPVLERDFASLAGLGWGGKSTMQIHRHLGTWFFLADILTTLELPPDSPGPDRCGTCTRCITACPTQAITAPRSLDARRCISYLTIESKGPIPLQFRRAIGDRIYGCDSCLDACPWNRHAQVSHEATFQARTTIFQHTLRDFLLLTDDTFRALFAKSPIKRIKRPAFLRNVCVALGNVGTPADLPALQAAAQDEHPLIAEHAQWAIEEIKTRQQAPQ